MGSRLPPAFARVTGNDGLGLVANYFGPEIVPFGIGLFDGFQLPFTQPFFHGLFLADGAFHRFMLLIPHQHFHAIRLGETLDQAFFVLPNTLYQIRGHADIQRAIALAGWRGYRLRAASWQYVIPAQAGIQWV